MTDLRLLHLTYAGSGKPTARVEFDDALTVVYGASDSGKSFIVESIGYMLGGDSPSRIPEAEGYSQILLGLRLPDGQVVTLLRTPDSGAVHLHRGDFRDLVTQPSDAVLTATHTARSTHSLALFLLGELGLDGVRIRKNEAGDTRSLGLTDLVHLSVITETRMWQPLSPVFRSAASSGRTAAKSVLKFLLTNDDDPVVDTGPNPGQRRLNKSNIALIDQIVLDLQAKLTTQENQTQLRERQRRIQTSIDTGSQALRAAADRHLAAVTKRMHGTKELARTEERLAEVTELLERFGLLERQYRSDLDRLAMVAEAGSLLGYFRVGTCVFCGAETQHQNPGHGAQETTQLHAAVQAETAKTLALLTDLLPTIADLRTQAQELHSDRLSLYNQMDQLAIEISNLEDQTGPDRAHLDELLQARSTVERELDLQQRIAELEERRSRLDGAGALPTHRPPGHIPSRFLTAFDRTLQRTLQTWQVPAVEYAEYDQYGAEIRAGGRDRSSRGKGVRSVLHAAFTTALARYALDVSGPRLGFVVLDSPVVTYREPVGEDVTITSQVVERFYRDMLEFPGQAVIIENGDPPADILDRARTYQFTATPSGRAGFFPHPVRRVPQDTT